MASRLELSHAPEIAHTMKKAILCLFLLALLSGCADEYLYYDLVPRRHSLITEHQTDWGQKVYSADECIGAVVNSVCHGTILPKGGYHKTCYGEMLFGRCTGPMF